MCTAGNCRCSIDERSRSTRCLCYATTHVPGKNPFVVISCGIPTLKTRAKRASLPVANALPASESEEGDKRKHGQGDTAPVNPGEDQLLRARRSALKQLFRNEKRSVNNSDNKASNFAGCYKPDFCACDCKPFGTNPAGAECKCAGKPKWRCVSNVTIGNYMSSCGFIFNMEPFINYVTLKGGEGVRSV